ncbi:MAG: glucose-6-phosphate isomerase [Actinobacteria bacterium]|nr:MAG: glucose-6-phosphate isomerase [Actinomycetota bacterium]
MSDAQLLQRLLGRDASLWPDGNVAPTRLGWLDVAERMHHESAEITGWAAGIDASRVVLLGMGGSSLGPEVLRAAVGSSRLVVLDTTDPETIASVDVEDAFFLVSSKSGSTLEPQALLAHFWERVPDGRRFAAITDPGSPLDEQATDAGFTRVFRNPPDIGGRYSVLSYFGLVPAALCGVDVAELCQRALEVDKHAAVELGVAMGEAARAGRDKLTVVVPERFAAFGLWVEQLIAESTGKRGTGLVPVPTTEVETGDDRHVVALELEEPAELGAQFMRWMLAVAVAGHVLGIDPFDEPDVAVAKANTAKILANLPLDEPHGADPAGVTTWIEAQVRPGDYVSVQAYLPYGQDAALERLRRNLRDGLGGMAVTAGYGPRFLHSTGQLHKGGPNSLVAVQLVGRTPVPSVPIPAHPYDFNTLIAAQSLGDHQSLLDRGRRVLRVALDDLKEIG